MQIFPGEWHGIIYCTYIPPFSGKLGSIMIFGHGVKLIVKVKWGHEVNYLYSCIGIISSNMKYCANIVTNISKQKPWQSLVSKSWAGVMLISILRILIINVKIEIMINDSINFNPSKKYFWRNIRFANKWQYAHPKINGTMIKFSLRLRLFIVFMYFK